MTKTTKLTKEDCFRIGLRDGTSPKILYKYTSSARAFQIIEDSQIYFPSITNFNDVFEFKALEPLFHKSQCWEYEKEHRIIGVNLKNAEERKADINPRSINSVIFGAKTPKDEIEKFKALITAKNYYWIQTFQILPVIATQKLTKRIV